MRRINKKYDAYSAIIVAVVGIVSIAVWLVYYK